MKRQVWLRTSILILCMVVHFVGHGQSNLHIRTNIWVFDTENPAQASYTPGLVLAYEVFTFRRSLSVRFSSFTFYRQTDLRQGAGLTLHRTLYIRWKNAINVYAGMSLETSIVQGKGNGIKPQPIAGFEFNRSIRRNWDVSLSLAYSLEKSVPMSFGFRYWISKDIRVRKPCLSCPD